MAHQLGFSHSALTDACRRAGVDIASVIAKARRREMETWARFYLAKPTRTYNSVAKRFHVKLNMVFQAFRKLNLTAKPRKGRPGFRFKPEKAQCKDKLYLVEIWFRNGMARYKIGRTFFTVEHRLRRSQRRIKRWKMLHT